MKKLHSLVFLVFALMPLRADTDHYVNILPGDRAAGLGGAYTAISDGPEGAYYNPAGLAFSPVSYFSLSTNAVQFKRFEYREIFPTVDYNRVSFSFVPNFFGIVQKSGGLSFAFTLATLDDESFDQRDRLDFADFMVSGRTMTLDTSLLHTSSQQELGFAAGILLNAGFSIGFGLNVNYSENRLMREDLIRIKDINYFEMAGAYYRARVIGFRPAVGVQIVAGERLTFGAAATASVPVLAFFTRQSAAYSNSTGAADIENNRTDTMDLISDGMFTGTNVKTSLGAAFFASPSLLVSGDFLLYVPVGPADGTVLTWNAALGTEWYVTPNFFLRAGLFTNNANSPEALPGRTNQADHVDLYGMSLSTGYSTSNFDLTLGVTGSYGAGKAQLLVNDPAQQNASAMTFQVFIGAGYH